MADELQEELEQAISQETKSTEWQLVELIVMYVFDGKRKTKKFVIDRERIRQETVAQYREEYANVPEEAREGRPTPEELDETYDVPNFEELVLKRAEQFLREPVLERGASSNEYILLPNRAIQGVRIVVQNKGGIELPN